MKKKRRNKGGKRRAYSYEVAKVRGDDADCEIDAVLADHGGGGGGGGVAMAARLLPLLTSPFDTLLIREVYILYT